MVALYRPHTRWGGREWHNCRTGPIIEDIETGRKLGANFTENAKSFGYGHEYFIGSKGYWVNLTALFEDYYMNKRVIFSMEVYVW